jgi:DNA (cytosine-5)-methyltransferase 1
LGLQRAGMTVVAAYDHWAPAVETYRANLGDHVHDVEITENLPVPDCEIIAGGPPCQGFSSAGLRRQDDHRNTLIGVYAKIIARVRPKAFIFENVEGFLTSVGGRHIFELLEPLVEAGYRIHLRKINAANYGVPQHRKRVVAIGGLGWGPRFPVETHLAYGAPGAHIAGHRGLPPTPTLGETLAVLNRRGDASDHVIQTLEGDDLKRAQLLAPGQSMKDLPEEMWHPSYRRRAFRRVMDGTPTEKRGGAPSGLKRLRAEEPSKAITGAASREFIHPTEPRPLTIRECATLQTFPLDFVFNGAQSDRIQLIGNAVPPLLGEAIGQSLAADIAAQPQVGALPGALLSFHPTASNGMSPALMQVTEQVRERFANGALPQQRDLLWA